MGLGNGLVNLFKKWGKGIGNAADHVWLRADAQKAIREEIEKKFQPKIERVLNGESRKVSNIKDLDARLTQSKKDLEDAKKAWQDKYNAELAGAKSQKQKDIADYKAQLQGYQDAVATAKAGKKDIFYQLQDSEARYDPSRTMFTDVNTGRNYLLDPVNGGYKSLDSLKKKEQKDFLKNQGNYDHRLIDVDPSTGKVKVINAFDDSNSNTYKGNSIFDDYYNNKISAHNADIRNAENEVNRANSDLASWKKQSQPQAWDDNVDLKQFKADFNKNNAKPTYSFNGQNYSKESELDAAYQKALEREQKKRDIFKEKASDYTSEREAEIAERIQVAKDMNKAKAFLAGTAGAGTLYAAAKAMYGNDDTDNTGNINNTDNIDNTDNTDNTDYGKPDPAFKAENTPEGKAGLNGKSIIDAGLDPDKADALAAAAYDKGVEDSNSIESSDDHFIDDDELYGLLKAMKDPHKADAVANYIYSKHGDKPDVQRLGWRGWLNKYYGDLLRSRMGLDPSSYNGMHISGGL